MPKLKVFFSRNVSAYQSKIKNTAFSLVDIEFLIELKPKKTLIFFSILHGLLRMPGEEIAFTAWPKINSHSQIYRYGQSIFCLPHRPKFSCLFDLCLHWVSVVQSMTEAVFLTLGWRRRSHLKKNRPLAQGISRSWR